jgi:hypothetical protein
LLGDRAFGRSFDSLGLRQGLIGQLLQLTGIVRSRLTRPQSHRQQAGGPVSRFMGIARHKQAIVRTTKKLRGLPDIALVFQKGL